MRNFASSMPLLIAVLILLAAIAGQRAYARRAAVEPAYPACAKAQPEGRWFYTDNPDNPLYLRTVAHSPDDEFWKPRQSDPARQGMDGELLDKGAMALQKAAKNAASLLVIRHGRLVKESYFLGHDAGTSKNVHSSSKSILSAAIGIAIHRGWIRSHDPRRISPLDESVAYFLPSYTVPAENQGLTLRHLLTMTAGLEWNEDDSEEDLVKAGGDWVQQLLQLPREEAPGQTYHYSTANTHLMSAILTNELHRNGHPELDTCTFVHRYLFGKLGISAEFWGRDPQGIFSGGYDVYLTPRELAKFGLLYLHDGRWRGEQVVPRGWVRESTSRKLAHSTRPGVFYGFNWFNRDLAEHEVFYSWGFGGQHVFVVRDLDLVVVITTDTHDSTLPEYEDAHLIVQNYVIPAVLE